MERVHLIPYEVRPSKHNQYETKEAGKWSPVGRSHGDDVNQRKFYRCFGICTLFMVFLLVAYVPASYHHTHDLQLNTHIVISGWSQNTSRDLKLYVLPNNVTSLIPLADLCPPAPLFLLVVVCSAVGNAEARSAIRDTWAAARVARNTTHTVRVAFLLGDPDNATMQEAVEGESLQYGDIIQEGFVDSYNNLTLKSAMMLKWVATRCPGVRFVMKTDDDMFVNLGALVRFLGARGGTRGLLVGSLICGARPIADPQSKWYAPRYMYSSRVYPNYLSGTGYVMSADVATRLYKASLTTPLFHLEDVYLTGICSRVAGIRPRDNPAFTFGRRTLDACAYRSSAVITSHRLLPADLRRVWADMANPRLDCTRPPTTPPAAGPGKAKHKNNFRKQVNKCA